MKDNTIKRLQSRIDWLVDTIRVYARDHWELLQENERLKEEVVRLQQWSEDCREANRKGHDAMLRHACRMASPEYWGHS